MYVEHVQLADVAKAIGGILGPGARVGLELLGRSPCRSRARQLRLRLRDPAALLDAPAARPVVSRVCPGARACCGSP